jgi:predicted ATPase
MLTLLGQSYQIEQVLPFAPWIDALGGENGIGKYHLIHSLSPVWRVELARLFPEIGAPGLELSTAPENTMRLFEAVTHLLDCLSTSVPLLLVLEDLHWADEMSIRLFSFLSRRIHKSSVLLVGTVRDEEVSQATLLSELLQELDDNRQVVTLTLSPLSRADTVTLVRRLGPPRAEKSMLTRMEEAVWASSRGNPFIVVETIRENRGGIEANAETKSLIPKRVRALIFQRLERLSYRARQLLAVAAIIGREFEYVLLKRAAGLGEGETTEALEELVRCRVVHAVEERFDFTHDLIREVSYHYQISPLRRKMLHKSVAEALEEVYDGDLESHYTTLAIHYREGGVWEKAAVYFHKAGKAAARRSANREAVVYFEQGLKALKYLPETRPTLEQMVDILIDLGPALRIINRATASEVNQTYIRARDLCQKLGETPKLFPVLWGLCRVHHSRGEFQEARELGKQLFSLAETMQNPALVLEAHHTLWSTSYSLGELVSAKEHCEHGRALYDPNQHRQHAYLYSGHDPGVCCGVHAALVLWLIGYPDQALQISQETLLLARNLCHPNSSVYALLWSARIHKLRGELDAVHELTNAAMLITTENGFPRWQILGNILLGALAIERGAVEQGVKQLRQAFPCDMSLAEHQSSLAFAAEAYGQAGQFESGIRLLAHALARARDSGICYYEAELYRLKGELLVKNSLERAAEAQHCFQKAFEVARSQAAKSLELRAAISLAELCQHKGRDNHGRRLLADTYSWFTEGFDTLDLRKAKALLDQ